MLRLASFPPVRNEIAQWFADHRREWLTGEAYRFAVELDGAVMGVVDIDGIVERQGELGYWLDRAAWGQGYGFEAASAVTHFAFEVAGLSRLTSGHAHDNPASGRVLTKLGFTELNVVQCYSRSRGENIMHCRYELFAG